MEKVLDASGLAEKVRKERETEGRGRRRGLFGVENLLSFREKKLLSLSRPRPFLFLTSFPFLFLPNKKNPKQTALHQNILRMQDLSYTPSYSDILSETETIFEEIVGDLLKKTNTKPDEVDAVITSCSCFAPMPSLAALVVHRFGMRKDVQTYSLAGMGCGASVVCVDMAARVRFFFFFFAFRVFLRGCRERVVKEGEKLTFFTFFSLKTSFKSATAARHPPERRQDYHRHARERLAGLVHRQRPVDALGELPLPRRRGGRLDDKHQARNRSSLRLGALRAHALGVHAGRVRLHGRRRGRGREERPFHPPVFASCCNGGNQVSFEKAGASRFDLG